MRRGLRREVKGLSCCSNVFWNNLGWFFILLLVTSWQTSVSTLATVKTSGSMPILDQGDEGCTLQNKCSTLLERSSPKSGFLGRAKQLVNEILTIGFLTPYNQNQLSLGAMRLAVERVNNDSSLLPGRILNFVAADIGSSDLELTTLPIRIMTEMRDNGTVAFIGGPEDSCVSEALVSAAWNLPIISYKCSDYQVSDKKTYSTFARTLPPSSKVSKSLVALLKKFEWDKIVLVVCQWKKDRWYQNLEAFKVLAKVHGINITATFSLHDYIPEKFSEMEKIVTDSYEKTRVYVFMGEHVALVDLVRALERRNLLDSGEYIIVSVDDKICDPKVQCNYIETDYLPDFHMNVNETEFNESDAIDVAENYRRRVKAFRSVLKLQSSYPRLENYSDIFSLFANYSTGYPFYVPYHPIFADAEVPIEAAYLYDAVMIYTRALSEGLDQGLDPKNGTAIFEKIRNRSYQSIQGFDVFIDANGDAEGNYTVLALLPDESTPENELGYSMQPVGYFRQNSTLSSSNTVIPSFHYFAERSGGIDWVSGHVPKSAPACGFRGETCMYKPEWEWSTVFIGTIFGFFLLIAIILVARHYRYEQKLACLLWKIDMRDVIMIPSGAPETSTKNTVSLCRQLLVADTEAPHDLSANKKAYTRIGFYKGTAVTIKYIHKKNIDLTRNIRKELKQIREFRHENIIPFIGASVESGNICILTAYSARGSLEDVLQNEDLHLDNMFLASLVADLIKGMIYLHDSEIVSHGNLKSSNCVVDSRWVLQITDFGLHEFKAGQEIQDVERERRGLLWRSPELLRQRTFPRGTQKGDVYSFGIILYEMIGRAGPWGKTQLTVQEIVERVSNPSLNDGQFLRPSTFHFDCGETILKCLEVCWEEDPELRPDFRFIRIKLKEMQAGLKSNIFDNMLSIMEKYACNLEDLVQDRTVQLMEEKKKTDALLHRMLPPTVAESLKRGEPVKAESFDSVTIYFSDIVGFTSISATSTPFQVVELLNDLYTCFDSIISSYDVYKVETIGDAYMVVSGLPVRNGNQHAAEVASMALHLLDRIQSFEIRHRPGERLKLRIGIHSGPVVAGVVGLKMPRYCLFGDTVNTASRMESSGEPLRIHISDFTKTVLETLGGYFYSERGIIPIKGKGEMRTYWLNGEDPSKTRRNSAGSEIEPEQSTSEAITLTFRSPSLHASPVKAMSPIQPLDNKYDQLTTSLLSECMDLDGSSSGKLNEKEKSNRYLSCSSIFQECKATLRKELLRKNGTGPSYRFRSAPIITFMEAISPKKNYHERNFV